MATDEELTQTAAELAASVRDFHEKLGLSNSLEERTSTSEKEINRGKRWVRLTVIGLVLDVILSLGLGGIAFNAKDASKALKATENELCLATQRSWDTRAHLAEIITRPSVLSPEVERLFPSSQVESLRLQIKAANANRAIQRKELVTSNGVRPVC